MIRLLLLQLIRLLQIFTKLTHSAQAKVRQTNRPGAPRHLSARACAVWCNAMNAKTLPMMSAPFDESVQCGYNDVGAFIFF
jgi:hypothetical protein